jgi:multiple sugar transport system ATP-binding protein
VTVGLAEPMGAETMVHFDVGAAPVQTQDALDLAADLDPGAEPGSTVRLLTGDEGATFTARLNPRTAARAGMQATLAVDVERIYLFDPATGRALR